MGPGVGSRASWVELQRQCSDMTYGTFGTRWNTRDDLTPATERRENDALSVFPVPVDLVSRIRDDDGLGVPDLSPDAACQRNGGRHCLIGWLTYECELLRSVSEELNDIESIVVCLLFHIPLVLRSYSDVALSFRSSMSSPAR